MTTEDSLPSRADAPTEQTCDLASVYPSDAAWEAAFALLSDLLDRLEQLA